MKAAFNWTPTENIAIARRAEHSTKTEASARFMFGGGISKRGPTVIVIFSGIMTATPKYYKLGFYLLRVHFIHQGIACNRTTILNTAHATHETFLRKTVLTGGRQPLKARTSIQLKTSGGCRRNTHTSPSRTAEKWNQGILENPNT
jgi:hypothetical protein